MKSVFSGLLGSKPGCNIHRLPKPTDGWCTMFLKNILLANEGHHALAFARSQMKNLSIAVCRSAGHDPVRFDASSSQLLNRRWSPPALPAVPITWLKGTSRWPASRPAGSRPLRCRLSVRQVVAFAADVDGPGTILHGYRPGGARVRPRTHKRPWASRRLEVASTYAKHRITANLERFRSGCPGLPTAASLFCPRGSPERLIKEGEYVPESRELVELTLQPFPWWEG